jgi:hypothetical protein
MRPRVLTAGKVVVSSVMMASTFAESRPVRIKRAGAWVASSWAMAAPRPLGPTPVMRTRLSLGHMVKVEGQEVAVRDVLR